MYRIVFKIWPKSFQTRWCIHNNLCLIRYFIIYIFTHRPAEAEKFRLEKLAEAHKLKTVLEAEAEAEAVKVRGEVSSERIHLFTVTTK